MSFFFSFISRGDMWRSRESEIWWFKWIYIWMETMWNYCDWFIIHRWIITRFWHAPFFIAFARIVCHFKNDDCEWEKIPTSACNSVCCCADTKPSYFSLLFPSHLPLGVFVFLWVLEFFYFECKVKISQEQEKEVQEKWGKKLHVQVN